MELYNIKLNMLYIPIGVPQGSILGPPLKMCLHKPAKCPI